MARRFGDGRSREIARAEDPGLSGGVKRGAQQSFPLWRQVKVRLYSPRTLILPILQ